MENKKPTIFLSSTIYDFKDLRSAIKYYLEEIGYEVLLSEYNDFPKPLDQNTFDACLNTLEKAGFYLLLIGSRVGGYYDLKNKISITQMEYRRAYELAKAGKLRCIFFVRDDLWKIKSDRDALTKYLETEYINQHEIQAEEIHSITNHSSPILNDAETIFNFINEVSRLREMQLASEGEIPFPGANWIHTFSAFRDIVDVLRANLGISEDLFTTALKINLKREIMENLSILSGKHKNEISPNYTWASFARKNITGDLNSHSQMPGRYLRWVMFYSITGTTAHGLSTRFIDQALMSGKFLQYNKDIGNFESTLLSERFFQLKNRIDRLQSISRDLNQQLVDLVIKYREIVKIEEDISIPNEDLLVPLIIANLQEDIFYLSAAILQAIYGNASLLALIKLNPPSPFIPEAERIEQETATVDDIKAWMDKLITEIESGLSVQTK